MLNFLRMSSLTKAPLLKAGNLQTLPHLAHTLPCIRSVGGELGH
jgi:hypothetical protein